MCNQRRECLTAAGVLFLTDGLTADGKLQTEIIYYRYSGLQNPMQLRSEKLLPFYAQDQRNYSEDMDGDGDVEIPSTSLWWVMKTLWQTKCSI